MNKNIFFIKDCCCGQPGWSCLWTSCCPIPESRQVFRWMWWLPQGHPWRHVPPLRGIS